MIPEWPELPALPEGVAELIALASLKVVWVPKSFSRGARVANTATWRIMLTAEYFYSLDSDSTFEDWRVAIGDILDTRRRHHVSNDQLGSPKVGAVQEGV
jgi:hypothetical protein